MPSSPRMGRPSRHSAPATSSARSRSSATAGVARPSQRRVRLACSSCTEQSSGSSRNVIQTSPRDSKQRWPRAPRRPSHPQLSEEATERRATGRAAPRQRREGVPPACILSMPAPVICLLDARTHSIAAMNELRPGVWHWQSPHPDWDEEQWWPELVSSYGIEFGDEFLLFDPLSVPDELRERATAVA